MKKSREACITLVLICCISGLGFREMHFYGIIIGLILLALIYPLLFYPFAIAFSWSAAVLGAVSSRTMLSVLFYLIVVPVAWFRRKSAFRSRALRQFKKNTCPVMKIRDHEYVAEDFLHEF
ncbi:MAG TPA: hypothetical protein VKR53_11370 [Puia sp.]|nr:hypothetical protein [Puia sp.]